jgi:hypothetical protein
MGDIGSAVKYLYSQFVLRDVLSFVTPGAIVVWIALSLFYPELLKQPIHWLLYIPIFGIFYMVGFAVQCFGEIFDIIRFTPKGHGGWCQRFKIFGFNWANPDNIWWQEDHERFADFFEATDRNEEAQQGRERMVVLKQMCANGFLASAIAGTFLAVNHCPWTYVNLCWVSLWAFLLTASLFWGYRVHVLRQYTRETIAINRRGRV